MIVLESRGTLRRFLLCRYGGAAWCVGQTEQAQAVVHCFGGSVGGSVEPQTVPKEPTQQSLEMQLGQDHDS